MSSIGTISLAAVGLLGSTYAGEGNKSLSKAKGVEFLRTENGSALLAVDSGQYSFVCKHTLRNKK